MPVHRPFHVSILRAGAIGAIGLVPLVLAAPSSAQILAPTSIPPESAQPAPRPPELVPGGRPAASPKPQLIRWTENWSALADPAARRGSPVKALKYIPVADGIYLSLGGEARLYYTDTDHLTLGARPGSDANSTVQQRLRLLADLHIGSNIRAFVEIGDNREYGARIATPPNEDKLDLEQAFVDVKAPLNSSSTITIRPGRFEMPLGSTRLVGIREGVNKHFLFQGVRAVYDVAGRIRIDGFVTQPMQVKSNAPFDDGVVDGAHFNGVYVSTPLGSLVPGLAFDAYYFDQRRRGARLLGATANETRKSTGARAYGRSKHWDYDLEATYQFGSFGDDRISAWAVMFEGGYNIPSAPLTPRLGVRANIFSGDGDPRSRTRGTFVPPFPKAPIYNNSDAAWFNLSNMIDIFPLASIKPSRRTTITIGPEFFWRQSSADATYAAPTASPLILPAGSDRYVGAAYNLDFAWQATANLAFRTTYSRFLASKAFEAGGGRSAHFFGLQSNIRF